MLVPRTVDLPSYWKSKGLHRSQRAEQMTTGYLGHLIYSSLIKPGYNSRPGCHIMRLWSPSVRIALASYEGEILTLLAGLTMALLTRRFPLS